MNEPGEWIFSAEAHRWMDKLRNSASGHEYRQPSVFSESHTPTIPRPGWEYGLFGFKSPDELTQMYRFVPCEYIGSMKLL